MIDLVNDGLAALGSARPNDNEFARMVAHSLAAEEVAVTSAATVPLSPPVTNMTTGGIFGVIGQADADGVARDYAMVVKIVQSVNRWPLIDMVPPESRQELSEQYDWRTERDVYRSALSHCLPTGLRMPQVWSVVDLDSDSAAIWMESVVDDPLGAWDLRRFCRAAHLLGMFAVSAEVAEVGASITSLKPADGMRMFLSGPARHVIIPALQSDDFWLLPAVAAVTDDHLRRDVLGLVERIDDLVDELCTLPTLPAHGDASPQNLIIEGDGFVAIDWGNHGHGPVGLDLGQLLAGRVNDGLLAGSELAPLAGPCLEAYVSALRQGDCAIPADVVRRGLALSMAVFSAMTALVSVDVQVPDSADFRNLLRGRAEMVHFVADLVRETDRMRHVVDGAAE